MSSGKKKLKVLIDSIGEQEWADIQVKADYHYKDDPRWPSTSMYQPKQILTRVRITIECETAYAGDELPPEKEKTPDV